MSTHRATGVLPEAIGAAAPTGGGGRGAGAGCIVPIRSPPGKLAWRFFHDPLQRGVWSAGGRRRDVPQYRIETLVQVHVQLQRANLKHPGNTGEGGFEWG